MPMIMGGISTHKKTIMPLRAPKSRELQSLEERAEEERDKAEDREDGREEPSPLGLPAEEEPSSPLLLVVDAVDVGGAPPAIVPTLIVVIAVSVPGDC